MHSRCDRDLEIQLTFASEIQRELSIQSRRRFSYFSLLFGFFSFSPPCNLELYTIFLALGEVSLVGLGLSSSKPAFGFKTGRWPLKSEVVLFQGFLGSFQSKLLFNHRLMTCFKFVLRCVT